MIESNHSVLCNRCLEVIKDNVPETTYNTWFAPIVPLKYEDKTLILDVYKRQVGYLTAKQALERLWKGISPTLTNKRKEMYAKYDFRKKPSSKEDEDEQPLYQMCIRDSLHTWHSS